HGRKPLIRSHVMPFRRKRRSLIRCSATLAGSTSNTARQGPCRSSGVILVIVQKARDLALRRSCLREVGQRSRVFKEFPLDVGRKSAPSHYEGHSQTFQNLLFLSGDLIKFQNCCRLSHPLGAHVFRYSHARIALSGHGSATLVIPP